MVYYQDRALRHKVQYTHVTDPEQISASECSFQTRRPEREAGLILVSLTRQHVGALAENLLGL